MPVKTISRQGRPATGVKVMNITPGARVSAVAPVVGEADDSGQTVLEA